MGEAAYLAAMEQRGRGYRVRQPGMVSAAAWDVPARERFRVLCANTRSTARVTPVSRACSGHGYGDPHAVR